MKNLLISIFCLASISLFAQAPEAFNFQGVLRDASGAPLSHHPCNFRISILQGSSSGNAAYVETDAVTTNAGGLFTIVVGRGSVTSGTFSASDWSHGHYFLDVELDTSGSTQYKPLSNTEIISVPYALYAKTAGSVTGSSTAQIAKCMDTIPTTGCFTVTDSIAIHIDSITHAPTSDTTSAVYCKGTYIPAFYQTISSCSWLIRYFANGQFNRLTQASG